MSETLPRKVRTFVALPVPEQVQKEVGKLLKALQQKDGDVKWVRPESLHITLKFLGSVPVEKLEAVFQAVSHASKGIAPFQLAAAERGAFPSLNRPRVLWVGLNHEGQNELHTLQQRIEAALEEVGFPRERRAFHPHLTLGRVRSPRNLQPVLEAFQKYPWNRQAFLVDRVLVMRSELRRDGARYSVLKEIRLGQ